jgi:hypothetical protein
LIIYVLSCFSFLFVRFIASYIICLILIYKLNAITTVLFYDDFALATGFVALYLHFELHLHLHRPFHLLVNDFNNLTFQNF